MYKLLKDIDGKVTNYVQRISDLAHIPLSEQNADYQVYKKWLDEGNEPFPAEYDIFADNSELSGTL